jgi:hypothetical protein
VEETWKQVQNAYNAILRKTNTQAAQAAPTVPVRPTAAPQPVGATPQAAVAPAAAPTAPADDGYETSTGPDIDTTGINVRRGMPGNAEIIANFITKMSGKGVSRMDVMLAFGQKSYLLAQNDKDQMIGLMGWQVENLITRVDEFYLEGGIKKEPIVHALVQAVEAASKELQSEVSFIFLPPTAPQDTMSAFGEHGYTQTTVKDIKIPAWREALQEANASSMTIMHKPLRKDRVLTPI